MGLLDGIKGLFNQEEKRKEQAQAEAIQLIDQGNQLEEAGQLSLAIEKYEAALSLSPQLPRAHLNRGNVYLSLGEAAAALGYYQKAAELDPNYAASQFNMGNALLQLGQLKDAERVYRRAIELKPDFIDAMVALGAVLDNLNQGEAAISTYQRVLSIAPGYAEVHSNMGICLQKLSRFNQAKASLEKALSLNPRSADAHYNLGNILKDMGQVKAAEGHYRQAIAIHEQHLDARSGLLFTLNYRPEYSPATLLKEAQSYGDFLARNIPPSTDWANNKDKQRTLNIGFVSGDFRNHPVGYFLESIITALRQNHPEFKLVAFSNFDNQDELNRYFRTQFHTWHAIAPLSDQKMAELIEQEAIDILIDLSGHSGYNRLPVFAKKCAPIQVAWLGYFATTGLSTIDYLIADPITLPAAEERNFSEKIWRLPETRLCFSAPRSQVQINTLPALENGFVRFACFNHLAKMSDDVVALWSQILHQVTNSRLRLKSPPLMEASAKTATLERFAQHGISPDRIEFDGLSSRDDYFRSYHQVDIALDPFPYTGGTTTMEALWMGVPVLTLSGEHFVARQGEGMMRNTGLADWVAQDAEAYLKLAIAHSQDLDKLAQLRAGLRAQVLQSPMFNASRFAQHFSSALGEMWQLWCDK